MSELLVFAANNTNADATVDRLGAWKRGMIVAVFDDGHVYGREEIPPTFVVIKLPGVPSARVTKYLASQPDDNPVFIRKPMFRRRLWQIQVAEIPAGARNKLLTGGALTIAASGGDFTWAQVKGFFARLDDGSRETADVTVG